MSSVTVVIPTYNRARWLAQTVASVLAQSQPALEIVIVDDGSTDDTSAVCASFSHPVRYLRQDNAGVAAARNHGAREARGEWIALLDDDDLWTSDKLEVQLAALSRVENARWSITGFEYIDSKGNRVPGLQGFERGFPVFREEGVSAEAFFLRRLDRTVIRVGQHGHTVLFGDAFELLFYGNFALPSTVLVHRDLFWEVAGFDEEFRFAEETEFLHRLSAVSQGAIVLTPLTRWRIGHGLSMVSSGNTLRFIEGALKSIERASKLRSELSRSEKRAYQVGKSRLLTRLAYTQLSFLDSRAARATLRRAWRNGLALSPRAGAIYGASLLPTFALKGLHAAKRRLLR